MHVSATMGRGVSTHFVFVGLKLFIQRDVAGGGGFKSSTFKQVVYFIGVDVVEGGWRRVTCVKMSNKPFFLKMPAV